MSSGCFTCGFSGWILPPQDRRSIPTVRRCDCMGGPSALANLIRNAKEPDPDLADQIERDEDLRQRGGHQAPVTTRRFQEKYSRRVDPGALLKSMPGEE